MVAVGKSAVIRPVRFSPRFSTFLKILSIVFSLQLCNNVISLISRQYK